MGALQIRSHMDGYNEKCMGLYAEREMGLEKEKEGNRWRRRKGEGENMKDRWNL